MEINKVKSNLEITPKRDIIFKRIFGAKGNESILKDFLESILDIKIESLELDLATELLPEFYDGKKSRVDVRTKLADGTEVNIEMQTDVNKFNEKRCLYYWSKIYANNLVEGVEYKELKKTICIWIINGERYNEFEDFQSKWQMMNAKNMVTNRFEDIEIYVIELKKFRESAIMKPSKKEFWLWFLDHTNEELVRMATENNSKIEEAREQLNKLRADKELMHRILLEEMYELDEKASLTSAKEEGKKEGRESERREIAKKLLKLNMTIEQISVATGLSQEEIEKIKGE